MKIKATKIDEPEASGNELFNYIYNKVSPSYPRYHELFEFDPILVGSKNDGAVYVINSAKFIPGATSKFICEAYKIFEQLEGIGVGKTIEMHISCDSKCAWHMFNGIVQLRNES